MYKHIVLGGTFDGLHKGHVYFLTQAFEAGADITIGLTSDRYIKRYKQDKGPISPYSKRYQKLTSWLRKSGYAAQAAIVPLHDRFGVAVSADDVDAIAVTPDNWHVAAEINTLRNDRGLPLLAIINISLVSAQDSFPISSTRIRNGEIDKNGRLYLPETLRPDLQKPLGRLLTGDEIGESITSHRDQVIVAVGDISTHTMFSMGVQPSLAIIDLQVERKPFQSLEAYKFPKAYSIIRVKSGPGYIGKDAVAAIKKWVVSVKARKRIVILVSGEEDLLAVPAIIHAPIGAWVYYGQPKGALWANGSEAKGGLVEVEVTKEKKKETKTLLKQFTIS